jgi:hypothetical protein
VAVQLVSSEEDLRYYYNKGQREFDLSNVFQVLHNHKDMDMLILKDCVFTETNRKENNFYSIVNVDFSDSFFEVFDNIRQSVRFYSCNFSFCQISSPSEATVDWNFNGCILKNTVFHNVQVNFILGLINPNSKNITSNVTYPIEGLKYKFTSNAEAAFSFLSKQLPLKEEYIDHWYAVFNKELLDKLLVQIFVSWYKNHKKIFNFNNPKALKRLGKYIYIIEKAALPLIETYI